MVDIHDYHVHTRTFSDGEGSVEAVVAECASKGCKDVAIADHCGEDGHFMYRAVHDTATSRIEAYVEKISSLKEHSLREHGVALHAALEISSYGSDYKFLFRDNILPQAGHLDLVLIDGWYISDPMSAAWITRDLFDREGMKDFPIAIAHPDFSMIHEGNIFSLVSRGIILELNNAKFTPADRKEVENILETCEKMGLSYPRFVLGSDAHSLRDVGDVGIVAGFVEEQGLEKFLIRL